MLEILGEVVYKAVAYRRVADAVERYPDDVASLYRRGEPPKIPGAGAGADREAGGARRDRHGSSTTRGCAPRCRTACSRCCRVPGVGPRTVRAPARGARHRLARRAARGRRGGGCAACKGLSERTEQNILEGIARIEQKRARACSSTTPTRSSPGCSRACATCAGVRRIEPAGSLRRRQPTIGDLDLLAAIDDPAGAHRGPRRTARGRAGPVGRHRQVEHRAARRAAGRPDGLPAGGVGHAPRPLHRQRRAQHRAARHGARPRLVAVARRASR